MALRHRITLASLASAVASAPLPALAHHAMGGAAPATAWEGLVSGLAHPVIGLDHLAFLVAAGVLAASSPRRSGIWTLAAFLGAGVTGAALHLAGIGLGPVEAAVALSVLLAGVALLVPPARRSAAASAWLAPAFAVAGLFHGHAYAEAVTGSGPAPTLAYLLALVAMQATLGLGVMAAARRFEAGKGGALLQRRLAGMAATTVGAIAFAAAILA